MLGKTAADGGVLQPAEHLRTGADPYPHATHSQCCCMGIGEYGDGVFKQSHLMLYPVGCSLDKTLAG